MPAIAILGSMDYARLDDAKLVPRDQALYLVTELAAALEHTDIREWPEESRRTFRQRLAEIIARIGAGE